MTFDKTYDPQSREPELNEFWGKNQIYAFDLDGEEKIFSIDTPPPTASGFLHLGHVYSYCHTDFIARFRRMQGWRVFYPMGFDDNGLPTERFVEKTLGYKSRDLSRSEYNQYCLQLSQEIEKDYRSLWQRLGLSIDWRYTYRTIDENAQRISQWSFLDLYRKGHLYHRLAPGIWCPECQASFAQADLNDVDRTSEMVTLKFILAEGDVLPVATTRPELLAACVAIFIHPSDERFSHLVGSKVRVPMYGQTVPILADHNVDPAKGTGAVMCCTFGDSVDVVWWQTHNLEYIELISENGTLLPPAGQISGMTIEAGRKQVKSILEIQGFILARRDVDQMIRIHERCDTPVEYRMIYQWFVNILDHKPALLDLGERLNWYPKYMKSRYMNWVENLNWDWCLSRQRLFGVPIPVWYCEKCGEVHLADDTKLPVNPIEDQPVTECSNCGGSIFRSEKDVMDTWATSSMSPQIVGQWLVQPDLYNQVFPFSLRPQAHDIIRTWIFYTIVKSFLHFACLPWRDAAISGWGIAGEGMGKISKSRGGGPASPQDMVHRFSADALRYWAASTGPGKDAVINEEKFSSGQKLVTKIWNVSRFASRFFLPVPKPFDLEPKHPTPADIWIMARLQMVIRRATDLLEAYDYAAAKNEIETFFWNDFADNYLEMCKQRLYDNEDESHLEAVDTLRVVLLDVLKLFAPFLPFITEQVYQVLYSEEGEGGSIHRSSWPVANPVLHSQEAEEVGNILVTVASAVRRFKSQNNLSLGQSINKLQLATANSDLSKQLSAAIKDIKSITRAVEIDIGTELSEDIVSIGQDELLQIGVSRNAT